MKNYMIQNFNNEASDKTNWETAQYIGNIVARVEKEVPAVQGNSGASILRPEGEVPVVGLQKRLGLLPPAEN